MRLTTKEIEAIKRTAHKIYGAKAHVYLFGSRINDDQRGGDIDLLINISDKEKKTSKNKVLFLTEIKKQIGDQKIDVVYDRSYNRSVFLDTISKQAIQLC